MFIQNLAPGAAERAGFGASALRQANPRLITVDISGYGRGNAYTEMKAYDLLVQAETGLAGITGHPAGPGRVGVSVADIACGMSAYTGVLEALLARAATGEGSHLEVSLFDSIADWMNVPLLYFEGTGAAPKRVGLAHPSICPYGAFPTADGRLVLISIQNEREWASFCAAILGDASLATAPGFESNNARVANRAVVDATGRQSLRHAFGRGGRDPAAGRADRVRLRQRVAGSGEPPGPAPGHDRHLGRAGEHRRAARDPQRRNARAGAGSDRRRA